jgi:hypothetical protein
MESDDLIEPAFVPVLGFPEGIMVFVDLWGGEMG